MMTEQLIIEVLKFFRACGGPYQRHKPSVVYRIIDCLEHEQYLLTRDQAGNIIQACCYWKIRETDFDKAKLFIAPENLYDGPVLFSTDYASLAGAKGLFRMISSQVPEQERDIKTICCEHKGRFIVCDKSDNKIHPWVLRR